MESQALNTVENIWFGLRWIPRGVGKLYVVTSDFHMPRAAYIAGMTLNAFYRYGEKLYKDDPKWTSTNKSYPRLEVVQVPTQSFCGHAADRNSDGDDGADINTKSLRFRALYELENLGTDGVDEYLLGEDQTDHLNVMALWPFPINTSEDPEQKNLMKMALLQAMNVVDAMCECQSPPDNYEGTDEAFPSHLVLPIPTTYHLDDSGNETNWKHVRDKCRRGLPQVQGHHYEKLVGMQANLHKSKGSRPLSNDLLAKLIAVLLAAIWLN